MSILLNTQICQSAMETSRKIFRIHLHSRMTKVVCTHTGILRISFSLINFNLSNLVILCNLQQMMTTKQLVISLTYYKTFLIVCTDDILIFILVLMIYFYIQSDSLLLPLAQAMKRAQFGSIERANVGTNILYGKTIIMCLGAVGSYSFLCKCLCPSDLGFSPSVLSLTHYSAPFFFSFIS